MAALLASNLIPPTAPLQIEPRRAFSVTLLLLFLFSLPFCFSFSIHLPCLGSLRGKNKTKQYIGTVHGVIRYLAFLGHWHGMGMVFAFASSQSRLGVHCCCFYIPRGWVTGYMTSFCDGFGIADDIVCTMSSIDNREGNENVLENVL